MDAASKVLVVEDEKSLRDVLCDKLRSESIGVIEALRYLSSSKFSPNVFLPFDFIRKM
jgi:DNA-binding response OmpR family regulator